MPAMPKTMATNGEGSKPQSSTKVSSRSWEGLNPPLSEWVLDAVASMGFDRMTPVQASTIPLFMGNKDVVVEAVTGSGKTLAFLIPLIERLLRLEDPVKKHHVGAIIISPTRELATQIHSVLLSIISFHGPSTALLKQNNVDDGSIQRVDLESRASIRERTIKPQLLLGGTTSPSEDLAYFLKNSPNLLIATPGRLNELLSSPHVHCPQSSFEALILDEADRLLDLGFKDDLQKILGRLPKQRRTGLFSASVSEAVGEIIRVGLRNPVKIAVKVKGIAGGEDRRTPASLQMSYILVPPKQRFAALARLLESLHSVPQKSIIYLSTCAAVDYFQYILPAILPPANDVAFHLIPLHGKHPAHVRIKNFSEFVNSQKPAILLTTDVAARGLDIPQVDLVVQVDPPSDPKVFLHRCGRAGRAGRKGLSVVFLQPGAEAGYIPFLDIRKTPVTPLAGLNIDAEDERGIEATKTMQGIVLGDRALHDKAQRAFVSWVQAYRKHQASSIFQLRDLDWEALGYGWGLLRLPKMPELKHWKGDRHLGNSIDMAAYAYKDKAREKVRLRQLSEGEARPSPRVVTPKHAEKNAWSDKVEQKRLRELRREKKRARREVERLSKMNPEEREQEAQMMELVEEVKRRNIHNEEPFNGFDD